MIALKHRIVCGTLAILAICTFLQQGPTIFGKLAQYPIKFVSSSPREYLANLSVLPSGKYFVSVGRTLGDLKIKLDDEVMQQSPLSAGVSLEIGKLGAPNVLSISWSTYESWRDRLFESPIVTNQSVGFLIHQWRIFVGIFMGPIASLLLIIMALVNLRLSDNTVKNAMPHFVFGVVCFFYTLFLSGIPDLFIEPRINTFIQVLLRIVISAAFIALMASYTNRKHRWMLALHAIGVVLGVVVFIFNQEWLVSFYKASLIYFIAATVIATIPMLDVRERSAETELMICMGLSWVAIQIFASVFYCMFGPSNLTVWSPSFITVLAISNFFFIYNKTIIRTIEVQLSKKHYYLAEQTAHDIRAPLAALNVIVQSSVGVDESTRNQIRAVVVRVKEIANKLLSSNLLGYDSVCRNNLSNADTLNKERCSSLREEHQLQLVSPRLMAIVSEKRFQFSNNHGVEICLKDSGLRSPYFVDVEPIELGRVMSNLIDNAVEAVGKKGKITVNLQGDEHRVQIIIEDTGIGMTSETLNKIGTRGYSYNKVGSGSGSGLGVYHAMEAVKSWNGELKYFSKEGRGTRATISLPRSKAPSEFLEKITVMSSSTIVILDDDHVMQQNWIRQFATKGACNFQVVSFAKPEELIQWYRKKFGDIESPLYLIDYEIGSSEITGLDVIEILGIGDTSILITNNWDDSEIRRRCSKANVKILPKAVDVPIECHSSAEECV